MLLWNTGSKTGHSHTTTPEPSTKILENKNSFEWVSSSPLKRSPPKKKSRSIHAEFFSIQRHQFLPPGGHIKTAKTENSPFSDDFGDEKISI